MNGPMPTRPRRLRYLLIVGLLSGCAHVPAPPTDPTGLLILQALPAQDVQLKTRGTLRPQYRAAGIAGQPLPYENAVESSLMMCAGLGPLFGACAGVLVGAVAVAGVTETLVDSLQQGGSSKADTTAVVGTLAPAVDFATTLAERITATAHSQLVHDGRDTLIRTDTACAAPRADAVAAYLAEIDIVSLELEFEPGYQYRLTVVARARTRACGAGSATAERRLAYRSRLQVLAGDATRVRTGFDAEIAAAVATLGADLARHLNGGH